MSFLSRLFGAKAPAKPLSLEEKIEGLREQSPQQIADIALNSQEQKLQLAAIELLPFGDSLKQLVLSESDSKIQGVARKLVAEKLDAGEINLEQLSQEITDKTVLLAITSLSGQDLHEQLLEEIVDQSTLFQLVVSGASTKLRQLAAEKLTDKVLLYQLLKEVKGKDKSVYKLIKSKCDAFKAQDKAFAELKARCESLCQAVEKHVQRSFDPQFKSKTQHYKDLWLALQADWKNQSPEQLLASTYIKRIDEALQLCLQRIEDQDKQLAEVEAKQRMVDEAKEQQEPLIAEVHQFIVDIYALGHIEEAFENDLRTALLDLQKQWSTLIALAPATNEQMSAFKNYCSVIETQLSLLKRSGGLLKQLAALATLQGEEKARRCQELSECLGPAKYLSEQQYSPLLVEAFNAVADFQEQQRREQKEKNDEIRYVGGLIRKAKAAVEQGKMRQASGVVRSIDEKLAAMGELPSSLAKQLESLNESLGKLKDWQHFAVLPKMEQLVNEMEKLVKATLEPDALAVRIQRLQDEWKSLSRGGGDQYQDLWERFHSAAQLAYAPCVVYFQQLSEQRQANLEKRKQLIEQLREYHANNDWEKADWKAVEQLLRIAKQEWRSYAPVDRADNKKVQAEFDRLIKTIQSLLDMEYKKNLDIKQSLVLRAENALAMEDIRDAISEVKSLQEVWKKVGLTRRREDQKIWLKFRKHCDAIFEKRQQQSNEYKAELSEHERQAEDILGRFEQLLQFEGSELLDARSQLAVLKEEFSAVGVLPKARIKDINERFNQLVAQFTDKTNKHFQSEKVQVWDRVLLAYENVRRYELSLASEEDSEHLKQKAQSCIDGVEQWPKGTLPILQDKLSQVSANDDLSMNEVALRELCIRMEISAGLETPEVDQRLRMDQQVERLRHGLGQRTEIEKLPDFILQWLSIGAVDDDVYRPLLARFHDARAVLA